MRELSRKESIYDKRQGYYEEVNRSIIHCNFSSPLIKGRIRGSLFGKCTEYPEKINSQKIKFAQF